MNRLRIVGYHVTPVMQTDDGETLSPPLQVNPVFIAANDWPFVQTTMAQAVEQVRHQVEGGAGAEPPGDEPRSKW